MGPCISNYFSHIEDPRIDRKKLHSLSDILILTICAMLSGANGYEASKNPRSKNVVLCSP